MRKDMLFQFVCFETGIDSGEFIQEWEQLMSGIRTKGSRTDMLYKAITKTKFNYISQHQWPQDDFQFIFKKDRRRAERFRESRIRVVQAGGYIPLRIGAKSNGEDEDLVKILAFSTKPESSVSLFVQLKPYSYLNIYQAYYESSSYSYIFEYFAPEQEAILLQQELKSRFPDIETAAYKECLVTVG
jgi:hypothetical protein